MISFVSALQIHLDNPIKLSERGYPTTELILYVLLDRDLNEIINDHTKPESELFDDAIVYLTLDKEEFDQLKNGQGAFYGFMCAHCGGGLRLTSCHCCGATFRDDQFRSGDTTPLSSKMVEFLVNNGHVFGQDPKIALAKEEAEFRH